MTKGLRDGDSPGKIATATRARGRKFAKLGGAELDLIQGAREASEENSDNTEY